MKLVGYGYDETEGLFWELQNQWTTAWGEDGFVRIKHGEIGIDSIAIACMPDLICTIDVFDYFLIQMTVGIGKQ